MARRYRVIQWATGNIGARALRTVIEHPHLDLVGVYVTSAAKTGKDAAELCGLGEPTGINATDSVDAIMAIEADCVLYMPALTDYDQICRLLASGKNVVTPRGEFCIRRRWIRNGAPRWRPPASRAGHPSIAREAAQASFPTRCPSRSLPSSGGSTV